MTRIVKLWLIVILLFLPFQDKILEFTKSLDDGISFFIYFLDEITVIVLFPLSIFKFYKEKSFPERFYLILIFPVFILILFGIVSGLINGSSLLDASLGVFYYVKNFIVIFIYASFIREFRDLKKIFNLLIIIAIILGSIAFIQEFWALTARYVFQKNITYAEMYVMRMPLINNDEYVNWWRLGIYRAPSFTTDSNSLGLYCLLFITLYTCMSKRVNFAILIPLFTGVFFSVSRIVYTGFMFIGGLQVFKKRKWFSVFMIPTAILLFMMFSSLNLDYKRSKDANIQNLENNFQYRVLSRKVASTIWKDHFLLGGGPGIFDTFVVTESRQINLQKTYHLPNEKKKYFTLIESLDKFWLRILAELGIVGGISFALLLILLIIILTVLRIWATSVEVGGLFTGLALFTVVILICSVGSDMNIVPILFTYSAFVGMGIGSESPYHK
jgi:hypothetical protein